MPTIRKELEQKLIKQVQYELDEIDIDNLVSNLLKNDMVSKAVEFWITEKLNSIIQEKTLKEINKQIPIIDSYLVIKIDEFLKSLGLK